MRLTKSKLKQIIKEELEKVLENIPMQRGADLHKILYEISQIMEDKGIYEPRAGIEDWLNDPDNARKVSEEDVKALYEMSDEIYDYM